MFTIRETKLTDSPALAALMCELGYETTPAEMRRRLKSILCDVGYRTLLAEVDGKVCGLIGTLAHPRYEHNDPSGRILALVISTTVRRRGIGRAGRSALGGAAAVFGQSARGWGGGDAGEEDGLCAGRGEGVLFLIKDSVFAR